MVQPVMKLDKLLLIIVFVLLTLNACKHDSSKPSKTKPTVESKVERPEFSAQQAYNYIQQQVDFGPRTPGSSAHKKCADFLASELKNLGAAVTVQTGEVERYDGKKLPMYNVIGSYNTSAQKRLLLCAHWDTRHVADQDEENSKQPIDGANDGGSGVGVLLEIARQLQKKAPKVGVDIVLFDVEDQGQPDYHKPPKQDTYCLGSQYWAKNPHIPNYKAQNGILLDMVGAKNATFTMEGASMYYAPKFMRQVWDKAIELKHSNHFLFQKTSPIIDDHVYVNQHANIPTIDIIQYDYNTPSGFGHYWHTHEDNMAIIDTATLQAVGETVLGVVYDY